MKFFESNVIAVGGGKGGVGKSFIASNIACGLAQSGRKVILVDGDLAGANIHTLFGIKYPEKTLSDYLKKKVLVFTDILLPTALPNLRLICGASDLLEIANPKFAQKQKLIGEIGRLQADEIIIDIGAGASLNNLDFFNVADTGIIVTTPSPPAMQNAYGFLKMAVHRKILGLMSGNTVLKNELTAAFADNHTFKSMNHIIELLEGLDPIVAENVKTLLKDCHYRLIVNMSTAGEGERISQAIGGVAYQYLNVHLAFFGAIGFDVNVENSIRRMEPIMFTDNSTATTLFMDMAKKLADFKMTGNSHSPSSSDKFGMDIASLKIKSSSQVQLCLHDEILFQEIKLHVQTEDFGMKKAQVVTLVFSGGEILVSRKTDYRELLATEDAQHAIAERVRWQHQRMLADIRQGAFAKELMNRKGL
ncbi:MAG TPA: P-loop NTPase [Nitrospirota bacterium]|nr:P-loop NTPase [Nitrospirota bacterium]